MELPIYQVDAFTSRVFAGNPAAVCPLERWLDDATLQAIAAENNLAETAYFVRVGDGYELRWFTPVFEIDLCGHATLASAFVIYELLDGDSGPIRFETKIGPLFVTRDVRGFTLDFPARPGVPCERPAALEAGLGRRPRETLRSRDYLAVFESEDEVRALVPHMDPFLTLDAVGIIVTAPGHDVDFISRFFAPAAGVPEDPVTGSAHCTLVPYWAQRLGRTSLEARQVSTRGGDLHCELVGDRVRLTGDAVLYLQGTIRL